MAQLVFRILGCGSSGGVPRIGGNWGECDPSNPRNRRTRCSMLVRLVDQSTSTNILIDSSPDLRQQLLDADIGLLDGVFYTHAHADHVNGIDDLRMIYLNRGERLPVWADPSTGRELKQRFGYAFARPPGSPYEPILKLNTINGSVTVNGAAGPITLTPFPVEHGTIMSKGFIVNSVAYSPDVSAIDEATWERLHGLDCWIVDALRRTPHSSHTHLEQTLQWIKRAKPRRAILTNMHIDLDYQTVLRETPVHVEPAYDGLELRYEIPL